MDRYEIIFKKQCSKKFINKILDKLNDCIFLKEINIAYVFLTNEEYIKIGKLFSKYILTNFKMKLKDG